MPPFSRRPAGVAQPARRRLVMSLAAAGLAQPLAARAQFRVEIAGVGARQAPITIATFRDESLAGAPLSQVIRANLERSGVFRHVPTDEPLDERSVVRLPDWRGRGTDALVAGSIARLADGRFDVRYKLWDLVKGTELLAQSHVAQAGDLRLAAHRISDEIYQQLTGERGVFATRIAYGVKAGSRYTLHVTDADGEGGHIALASPQPIISPAWSPDGRQLAYVSFEDQKAVIWVQDLVSGNRKRVANFRGSNSAPAFSPDGRTLAVALAREGLTQVYTLPVGGGNPTRLTQSNAIDTEPIYSADGRSIYFVSDRGGGPQIYRMGAGGGGAERVTFTGSYNISPTLSPDGKSLAYISRQGGAFRVTLLEMDTGTVRALSDTTEDERPSFAPNGRLIVYASRVRGADVLMTTTLDGKIKSRLVVSSGDVREPCWGPFGR
ncbi:MAG: Tol-Pal system protein TolB [Rubrivivax sp.]|nr:Tol-Pal system protein TolB [Rubrivivax sp.]